VTIQADNGAPPDVRLLSDEWRAANDHVRELEGREAGVADAPTIAALPPELTALASRVQADPMLQRSFGIVSTSLGMVELERLVVFQKHINLAHVRRIQETLGPAPSREAIFRLCLPFDHPHPPYRCRRIAPNAWVFVSASDDFRFLEPTLLRADQILDYAPQGPIGGVIGLIVGYGSNYLNAIWAENRLILNNGSHRAFALRELGVTHVPCLIQHVSRQEELEVIASADLVQNLDLYLKAARPPMLKDYFDPELRKIIAVPCKLREIKVTFGVEQIDVPA
jgi:hypothetical protein